MSPNLIVVRMLQHIKLSAQQCIPYVEFILDHGGSRMIEIDWHINQKQGIPTFTSQENYWQHIDSCTDRLQNGSTFSFIWHISNIDLIDINPFLRTPVKTCVCNATTSANVPSRALFWPAYPQNEWLTKTQRLQEAVPVKQIHLQIHEHNR